MNNTTQVRVMRYIRDVIWVVVYVRAQVRIK